MHPITSAVISCAGMGSRLELNMPKCLVPIHGRALIDYMLELLTDIPDIRIVVGFMEEEVVSHVRQLRGDAIFVRNPEFQTTSNTHSLWLASRDLRHPFLTLDGDTIIHPGSFEAFRKHVRPGKSLIGITPTKTQEAVFVELDQHERIVAFQRNPPTPYEWSGVAYLADVTVAQHSPRYVYHILEPMLPLRAHVLDCFEIDTPEDLDFTNKHFVPNALPM
jgi:choline kinase